MRGSLYFSAAGPVDGRVWGAAIWKTRLVLARLIGEFRDSPRFLIGTRHAALEEKST